MEGHIGVGWKTSKDVQGAIKGAVTHAKLNIVPVRRGYNTLHLDIVL
jgi:ribosomal protein S5